MLVGVLAREPRPPGDDGDHHQALVGVVDERAPVAGGRVEVESGPPAGTRERIGAVQPGVGRDQDRAPVDPDDPSGAMAFDGDEGEAGGDAVVPPVGEQRRT